MAVPHVSVILNDFRTRLGGMGIDRFAKHIGARGGSSIQRYMRLDYEKDQIPADVIDRLLTLVGQGDPPIQRDEVIMLSLLPEVRQAQFGGKEPPLKTVTFGGSKGERPQITEFGGSSMAKGGPLIDVFAAAQGGQGHHIITFEPIESRPAPDVLAGVRGAYGILIKGDSMIPAYRPGDIAWVNPHKVEERDTDVVLYHVPPHGEPSEAIIKHLSGFSPKEWRLQQFNPARDFIESRRDWPVCHRIVGKQNVK